MYPTDMKGICTGPAKQVKCKVDYSAMANIMPLSIFKMLNPSEFDKDGNSLAGFNRDMTRLSAIWWQSNTAPLSRMDQLHFQQKSILRLDFICRCWRWCIVGADTTEKNGIVPYT